MSGTNKKYTELEPKWQSLFGVAKEIVVEEMAASGRSGWELVLEMLDYGKRLDAARTLEGDPYDEEMQKAASIQDAKFAVLEAKALEEIQRLAAEDDPVLAEISKAAKQYSKAANEYATKGGE